MKRRRRGAALATALALASGGCVGAGDAAAPEVVVRDSAGVTIVENGRSPADERRLQARRALRIGELDDDGGPYQFDRISGVFVDTAGRVWVANRGTGTVRLFDGEGRFVRELGGRGEGPGEVPYIGQAWFTDTMVVFGDWNKTVAYGPEGELLGDFQLRRGGTTYLWGAGPAGWVGSRSERDPTWEVGMNVVERYDLRAIDPATGEVGPVMIPLPPRILIADGRSYGRPTLGNGEPAFAIGSGGRVWGADSVAYEVRVHGPDGRLERIVRKAQEPLTTEAAAERFRRAVRDLLEQERDLPAGEVRRKTAELEERLQRELDLLPGLFPPIAALLVAPDGGFWVVRGEPVGPPTEMDFFGRDGRYRGRLVLPEGFDPRAARGSSLSGVLRDRWDVQHAAVFAIE